MAHTGPLLLCPGGYHQLADECGNASTAGLLALGRLTKTHPVGADGNLWMAVYEALTWGENLYRRRQPCPRPCVECEAARAAAAMTEV